MPPAHHVPRSAKKTISRNDNYPFRREDIQAANPFGSPSNPFGSPESGESLGEGNPFASSPRAHKAPSKGKDGNGKLSATDLIPIFSGTESSSQNPFGDDDEYDSSGKNPFAD